MCFFEERDGEVHCYIAYILIIPDIATFVLASDSKGGSFGCPGAPCHC